MTTQVTLRFILPADCNYYRLYGAREVLVCWRDLHELFPHATPYRSFPDDDHHLDLTIRVTPPRSQKGWIRFGLGRAWNYSSYLLREPGVGTDYSAENYYLPAYTLLHEATDHLRSVLEQMLGRSALIGQQIWVKAKAVSK